MNIALGFYPFIKSIDDAVGGVMAKLREHGLEENTMVLFASDNGAVHSHELFAPP